MLIIGSAGAQNRQPVYSGHDHTVTPMGTPPLRETWADCKTPGNGRTYSVGTIEIRNSVLGPQFSGVPIQEALPGFGNVLIATGNPPKQVVCLQCRDANQSIVWQEFFYGRTPLLTGNANTRATNARGISVWPADPTLGPSNTRIAICGETYDEILPASQDQTGWTQATATDPSGFIAVFDGDGLLKWTHHFFVPNSPTQPSLPDCAITDVSIRRELGETPRDVVTYCGVSSHGNPGSGTSLSPFRSFLTTIPGASNGATNQGANQWDGIVGRLSRPDPTVPPATTATVFHAIVSGPGQDGAFGLAEIDANRFAIVGAATLGGSGATFPVRPGTTLGNATDVGVLMVFNAVFTPVGSLILEAARPIGSLGQSARHTIARDVLVGVNALGPFTTVPVIGGPIGTVQPFHMLYVVGSTDHPELMDEFSSPPFEYPGGASNPQNLGYLRGPTDGFVAAFVDEPFTNLLPIPIAAAFVGGVHEDGCTGVQGWNEFGEHFTVASFTQNDSQFGPTDYDIAVGSFFFDNALDWLIPQLNGQPANPPPFFLRRVRTAQLGGTADDLPAGMGQINALDASASPSWSRFGLGDPAGGGVAVDPIARVNVVGTTSATSGGTSYNVVGAGLPADQVPDAVRSTLDLLPLQVGRTDGAGDPVPGGIPTGFTGGTSPPCLSPFGIRIDATAPFGMQYPSVQRMLLDYEGSAPGSGPIFDGALILSRPPYDRANLAPQVIGLAVQFKVPTSSPPVLLPDNVEVWTTNSPVQFVTAGNPTQAMRVPFGDPSSGSQKIAVGWDLSAQVICLLVATQPGGACSGGQLITTVASPALWIQN